MVNENNYLRFKEMHQDKIKLEKNNKKISWGAVVLFTALSIILPTGPILIASFFGVLGAYAYSITKLNHKFTRKYLGMPTGLKASQMEKEIEDFNFHIHEVLRERKHQAIKDKAKIKREEYYKNNEITEDKEKVKVYKK